MQNEKAVDAFMVEVDTVKALLAGISAKAADFFEVAPDDVDWSDVGTVGAISEQLQDVHDRLYQQGEYAE